jgi:hypothetical protein
VHRRLDEEAHEAELDAVLLLKTLLHALAHLHDRGHVDLVKGGQDGVGALRLQQTLGHARAQAAHGHALLGALAQVQVRCHRHLGQRMGRSARGDCGSSYCFRSRTGRYGTEHIALGDAAIFAGATHRATAILLSANSLAAAGMATPALELPVGAAAAAAGAATAAAGAAVGAATAPAVAAVSIRAIS